MNKNYNRDKNIAAIIIAILALIMICCSSHNSNDDNKVYIDSCCAEEDYYNFAEDTTNDGYDTDSIIKIDSHGNIIKEIPK